MVLFKKNKKKHKMDIRDEGPDQTAVRMLNLLKILKYKPTDDNMYET